MIVAMPAAARSLEVIRLRGLNAAKAGTAALDIDHNRGKIRPCQIGKSLAFERNSRAGGRRHHALARGCQAIDHVDGGHFTFGLQECAADFGHALCHVSGNFGLRRDRIAEVVAAARQNCSFRNGLIALHQYFFSHTASLTFLR